MKKSFKILLIITNIIYGLLISYLFPTLFAMAFNKLKGNSVNADGEAFMSFAWIILLLIPILYFCFNYIIIKKYNLKKLYFILSFLMFLFGFIIGIIYVNNTYSINYTNLLDIFK